MRIWVLGSVTLLVAGCGGARVVNGGGETSASSDTSGVGTDAGETGAEEDTSGLVPDMGCSSWDEACGDPEDPEIDVAIADLDLIIEGAASFFAQEGEPGPAGLGPHKCPTGPDSPWGSSTNVDTFIAPPLSTDCNVGPEQKCVPSNGAGGPGHYDIALWDDWSEFEFAKTEPHKFHYRFVGRNFDHDYGRCQFTAMAFGDLDADTVIFSTYARSGELSQDGLVLEELFVDYPFE